MTMPTSNRAMRRARGDSIPASWASQHTKSAIYPTNTILTTVPNPINERAVKNTTISNRILAINCQFPKLMPRKPLMPIFMQENGSTPNAAKRSNPTLMPINKMPATIIVARRPNWCLYFSIILISFHKKQIWFRKKIFVLILYTGIMEVKGMFCRTCKQIFG